MRLLGVVKSTSVLSSRLGVGGTTAGWIIEEFTAQMRAVSKIALHRRSNLATFLEINGIVAFSDIPYLLPLLIMSLIVVCIPDADIYSFWKFSHYEYSKLLAKFVWKWKHFV